MTYTDPRQLGFNYGIGWGDAPKPAIYEQAEQLCRRMSRAANDATQAAWKVEMALRDLRLAETEIEKKNAIAKLYKIVIEYDLAVVKN